MTGNSNPTDQPQTDSSDSSAPATSIPSDPGQPSTKTRLSLHDLPDLLTVREVAQILRVSPLTIKRWGKKGKLPFIRINSRGDRRYKKEAVLWLLGMEPVE